VGAIHKVGDGKLTQLWNDVWLEFVPLRANFPKLFEICDNKEGSCDVPALKKDGWSKSGSLRGTITEVMMHNTSHMRKT
jgi:hypothetical protein